MLGILGFLLVHVPRSMLGKLLAGSFSSAPGILRLWDFPLTKLFLPSVSSPFLLRIRFSLQLVPISPALIWNFGLALDICTSTPRYSLGVSVLCSLRQLGMPIEVPDLPSTSWATMFRTANASEVLGTLYEEVCATRDGDWAVFCPRHQPWILDSSV